MSNDAENPDLLNLLQEFVRLTKEVVKNSLLLDELYELAEKSGIDEFRELADEIKISESRKQLMQSWMVGYEKAIMQKHFHQSKLVTDDACYFAVEDFTNRMKSHNWIPLIRQKEFETMQDAIQHHVDNLINAGLWKVGHEPKIYPQDDSEFQELIINVPECQFLEGCKWARESEYFNPVTKFRCQRIGSFVGAVKKYLKDGKLPPNSTPDYFMTRIHEENGCSAVVFARYGLTHRKLISKYNTLPKKEN